jgi:trehalose monomycolate/heme transporter
MFEWFGRLAARRRWWILTAGALFVAVAAAWGTGVFSSLSSGGFEDPDSESARAAERIAETVGRQDADVIVLYSSDTDTVDSPRFSDAVNDTLGALPKDDVPGVTSYYTTRAPAFVSEDRHATYAVLQMAGADDEARMETFEKVRDDLDAPGLTTELGGNAAINSDVSTQVGEDIARAEAISMPLLMILLVVIFGSLVAAGLPLVVGGIAILGAFTALRVMTLFTDVSVFSINIITLLGLGLAIDYALFVVSRFREELAAGKDVQSAVVRTVATAGRTVAFSGLTVAISMSGLLLFPQNFLRSMGYGGIAAVLVAMTAALTVLPALLAVLGHRVDSLRVPFLSRRLAARRTRTLTGATEGLWARVARSVMRRPALYMIGTVGVLVLLASPFARVEFGGVDTSVLPADTSSRIVADTLADEFPGGGDDTVNVLVTGAPVASVQSWLGEVGNIDGVSSARIAGEDGAGADTSVLVTVTSEYEPMSTEARGVVEHLRDLEGPDGAEIEVGGRTAQFVDLLDSLADTLPWMALLVVTTAFVLLFLAFGSLVMPAKAIVMNVLSIGASFGAVVWVFQDGHLSGLLGFTSNGTIEATQPILMLAILFGLSMDYEVFLLSRVREQWDATGDNTAAVATGVQRTGGIITSAALLLLIVIGAFSTSGITFIKMIGVGMVVAIVVDATLVRLLLVPATMRLLGRANWWAPGPLRRAWERFGLRESDGDPAPAVIPAQPGPDEPDRSPVSV